MTLKSSFLTLAPPNGKSLSSRNLKLAQKPKGGFLRDSFPKFKANNN